MLMAAIIAAASLAGQATTQSGGSAIQMRTVRFWLGQVGNQKKTSVLATVEVPYSIATPVGTGPGAYIAYTVVIRVKSEDGTLLDADRWTRHAPAALRDENASGLETLNFGVVPGHYWLEAEVTDSATGKTVSDSSRFDGYPSSPGASDLLLASRMRQVPASDTSVDVGEMARGDYRFATAPSLHIDLTQPTMGLLMEAYTPEAASATLAVTVAMADGTDLVPLLPKVQSIPAGGGIMANEFSLEGLPAGQYLLKANLTMNGKTIERQAPFTVNPEQVALERSVSQVAANRGLDAVYFNSLPEDSLDAYAEVLTLVPNVTGRELAPYKKDELSLAAKRNFLIEFWATRDDIKSTPENEYRMAFYDKIGYADSHFGTRFVPGWKTPMGRIYAKYGAADDSTSSHMSGRGIPYTVWRMTHGKPMWFIFGDRSNTGSFVLLRAKDFLEQGTPGWRVVEGGVSAEAAHDIAQWLGLPQNYFDNEQ
jgi:GWxTD domain-containing protein